MAREQAECRAFGGPGTKRLRRERGKAEPSSARAARDNYEKSPELPSDAPSAGGVSAAFIPGGVLARSALPKERYRLAKKVARTFKVRATSAVMADLLSPRSQRSHASTRPRARRAALVPAPLGRINGPCDLSVAGCGVGLLLPLHVSQPSCDALEVAAPSPFEEFDILHLNVPWSRSNTGFRSDSVEVTRCVDDRGWPLLCTLRGPGRSLASHWASRRCIRWSLSSEGSRDARGRRRDRGLDGP
jgi:hypothetical protein